MLFLAVFQLAVQWTATTLAGIGHPADCCLKLTDKNINVTKLEKYVVQDPALCSVKAVRFTTIHGKTVCADPESNWTKFAMCVVDQTTPVSMPSKKTAGRIETETMVKSPVEDDSLKKSSPSFNRESAQTSSVDEGDESESRKSSDVNESPAGISKTKNTELEESLYSEERDTLSSVMNEQSPNKNTMFCIKQVPAKSSRSYFCIKGSL
ncbi:hypothetical protein SRHO_G00018530 [Serrasalmus rhombeus]